MAPNFKKYLLLPPLLLLFTLGLFFLKNRLSTPQLPGKTTPRINLQSNQEINLVANNTSSAGIDPNTGLLLTSNSPLDTKVISQSLKISPVIPFKVTSKSDKSWEITFTKPLESAKIYKITLPSLVGQVEAQDFTWAFQVASPLQVTGTYPGNKSVNIPTNAAIDIYLNNPDFVEADYSKFISISPKLDGHIEKHQNTLAFVHGGLSPATVYTVTVKAGIALKDKSQKLEKDYVFQFETDNKEKQTEKRFEFTQTIFEATPNQNPIITISNYDIPQSTAKSRLYQLSDTQFLECLQQKAQLPSWSYYARSRHRCQTSGNPSSEFELSLKTVSEFSQNYFELPTPLDQPFYLLEVDNPNSEPSQTLIQITSLSWYYWFGQKESLVWINDLQKQQPISSVKISLDNQLFGSSDNNGLLKFATPASVIDGKKSILSITYNQRHVYNLVETVSNYSRFDYSSTNNAKSDYWEYLYTDRSIYLPQDKVYFWGVIKARQNQPTDNLVAKLLPPANWYVSDQNIEPLAQINLDSSLSGTYNGSFDLTDVNPGWYLVSVYRGDKLISSKGFTVETFTKPAFKIIAKPDKLAIRSGESNRVTLQASFYDGTPLSNTTLKWTAWGTKNTQGEVTTDISGRASVILNTEYQEDSKSYWPSSVSIDFTSKDNQEAEIRAYTNFAVFGPDYHLKSKIIWDPKSSSAQGTLTIQKYDYHKLNIDPWSNDHPPVPNQKATLKITRVWYERFDDGEYYDPINKTSQKKYRYERRTQDIGNQDMTTNTQGIASFSFPSQEGQEYELLFSSTDTTSRTAYSFTTFYSGSYGGLNYYQQQGGFNLEADKDSYKLNETINLKLLTDQQPVPTTSPNKYLLLFVRDGQIITTQNQTASTASLQFKPDYMPNIYAKAIWFNGKTYLESGSRYGGSYGINLNYFYEEKTLNLKIKPDKSKYSPGDEVSLQFEIVDTLNKPHSGKLLVSVIDEALNDIEGVPGSSILSNLYSSLPEGGLVSYSSHKDLAMPLSGGGGAERGGGGGDRTNLKNTAYFQEIEFNNQGKATLKFKLPDNITSWRLTALGISPDLYAGDNYTLIPVTKPLFVSMITAEEFVTSDKPKITAIAYGDSLKDSDEVKFSIQSSSLSLKQNLSAKAFQPVDFDLGQLTTGQHQIRIEAVSGNNQDAIVRPVTIIDSRFVLPKSDFVDIKSKYQPNWPSALPVTVTLIDKSRGFWYPYLQSLSQLSSYGKQERLDRVAAQSLSQKLLKHYFNQDLPSPDIQIDNYFTQKGYVLLKGGDADLTLSAKMAATGLPQLSRLELKSALWQYFHQEKDITRASAALWGLAELSEPILSTIQSVANENNTPLGKLYLAQAAAALGDQPTAKTLFNSVITTNLVDKSPYKYIKISDDTTQNREATAVASILSARLNDSALTNSFWAYLDSTTSTDNIVVLERAIALNYLLKNLPSTPTTFELTLKGQKSKKTISEGQSFSLEILPSDINSFSVEPLSGQLSLIARYWQKIDPQVVKTDPNLSLSLKLNPGNELTSTQLAQVSLDWNLDQNDTNQNHIVTVNLPSGLRYVENPWSYRNQTPQGTYYAWPFSVRGNQLSFWVSRYQNENKSIYFLVRPINKGSFTFEPAIIYGQDSTSSLNFTPPNPDIIVK